MTVVLESVSIGAFLNVTSPEPGRWEEDVAALDVLPIEHVEVWLEYLPSRRELVALASVLRGRRVIMHAPFIGASLASGWDALAAISLDRSHHAIELAGLLGCEVVTLHAGPYAAFEDPAAVIERLVERLGRFSSIARPVVTVENMPARGGATAETIASAEDLARLTERAPQTRLTLDVGHCLQNGEDPVAVFAAFAPLISNIHLHDGTSAGSAHKALGTGELDLHALLGSLQSHSYDRFLTIETLSSADLRDSLDALEQAGIARRSRASAA